MAESTLESQVSSALGISTQYVGVARWLYGTTIIQYQLSINGTK